MDLPPDQKAELFHALLYRKGARTIKGAAASEAESKSLRERVASIFDMKAE